MNEPNRNHPLVGRRIIAVDHLTDDEMNTMGWSRGGGEVVLVLDDQSLLFAQSDEEGNNMGAMMHEVEGDCHLVLKDREV